MLTQLLTMTTTQKFPSLDDDPVHVEAVYVLLLVKERLVRPAGKSEGVIIIKDLLYSNLGL